MVKFLLTLILCMTSAGFHASGQVAQGSSQISGGGLTPEQKEANRKQVCDMGFSCEGEWVTDNHVHSLNNGVSVVINSWLSFVISDNGIEKLLKEANGTATKTFIGSDLSTDYPNILKHMEIKVEARGLLGSLYGSLHSGNTQYFEIKLNLPIACDGFSVLCHGYDQLRKPTQKVQYPRSQQIIIGKNFNLYNDSYFELVVPLFRWNSDLLNIVLDPNFNSYSFDTPFGDLKYNSLGTESKPK